MTSSPSITNAPKPPRLGLWFGTLVFLAFWVFLLLAGRSAFLRDPGSFWHTVVGERVLTHGFFDTDPFSFTHLGRHWVAHEWIGEVSMAWLHRLGRFDSMLAAATGIVAILFTLFTVRLWRTGLHPIVVFGLVALVFGASSLHFHVRPHLMTMVGVVFTMILLLDVEAGRAPLRRLWWLVPMFWIWANTHGGVIGGYAMLGMTGLGWLVKRDSPLRTRRDVGEVSLIGLLCVGGAFATPYGADIVRVWLDILTSPRIKELIQEHAAPDYRELEAWPVVGLAGLYLFLLAGIPWKQRRVGWLVPLLWMVQAFLRVRHGPLFAMSAMVVFADMWNHTRWAVWLARTRPDFYQPQGVSVAWGVRGVGITFALIAGVLLLHAANVRMPIFGRGWARLDSTQWPTELIEPMRRYELKSGPAAKLFNDVGDGGFVIYFVPGYRNFVDDRCELYGQDWLGEIVEASRSDTGTAAAMEKWDREFGPFDFALSRTGTRFDDYFRNRPAAWECVQSTPTAAFYRRRE